jgi:hypothetical protein
MLAAKIVPASSAALGQLAGKRAFGAKLNLTEVFRTVSPAKIRRHVVQHF